MTVMVPYVQNSRFTGRKDILEKLEIRSQTREGIKKEWLCGV